MAVLLDEVFFKASIDMSGVDRDIDAAVRKIKQKVDTLTGAANAASISFDLSGFTQLNNAMFQSTRLWDNFKRDISSPAEVTIDVTKASDSMKALEADIDRINTKVAEIRSPSNLQNVSGPETKVIDTTQAKRDAQELKNIVSSTIEALDLQITQLKQNATVSPKVDFADLHEFNTLMDVKIAHWERLKATVEEPLRPQVAREGFFDKDELREELQLFRELRTEYETPLVINIDKTQIQEAAASLAQLRLDSQEPIYINIIEKSEPLTNESGAVLATGVPKKSASETGAPRSQGRTNQSDNIKIWIDPPDENGNVTGRIASYGNIGGSSRRLFSATNRINPTTVDDVSVGQRSGVQPPATEPVPVVVQEPKDKSFIGKVGQLIVQGIADNLAKSIVTGIGVALIVPNRYLREQVTKMLTKWAMENLSQITSTPIVEKGIKEFGSGIQEMLLQEGIDIEDALNRSKEATGGTAGEEAQAAGGDIIANATKAAAGKIKTTVATGVSEGISDGIKRGFSLQNVLRSAVFQSLSLVLSRGVSAAFQSSGISPAIASYGAKLGKFASEAGGGIGNYVGDLAGVAGTGIRRTSGKVGLGVIETFEDSKLKTGIERAGNIGKVIVDAVSSEFIEAGRAIREKTPEFDLKGSIANAAQPVAEYVDKTLRENRIESIKTESIPQVLARTRQVVNEGKSEGNTGTAVAEDTKNLIIFSGGYAGMDGRSGYKQAQLMQPFISPDTKLISIRNKDNDTNNNLTKTVEEFAADLEKLSATLEAISIPGTDIKIPGADAVANTLKSIGQMFVQSPDIASLAKPNFRGFSKDAIEMASQALAALDKNPEIKIRLVGVSGGTYVAEEAAKILELLGLADKVEYVGLGGPNFVGGLEAPGTKVISPNENLGAQAAELTPFGFHKIEGPENRMVGVYDHIMQDKEGYGTKGVAEFTNAFRDLPTDKYSLSDILKRRNFFKHTEAADFSVEQGSEYQKDQMRIIYQEFQKLRRQIKITEHPEALALGIEQAEQAFLRVSPEGESIQQLRKPVADLRMSSEKLKESKGLEKLEIQQKITKELPELVKQIKEAAKNDPRNLVGSEVDLKYKQMLSDLERVQEQVEWSKQPPVKPEPEVKQPLTKDKSGGEIRPSGPGRPDFPGPTQPPQPPSPDFPELTELEDLSKEFGPKSNKPQKPIKSPEEVKTSQNSAEITANEARLRRYQLQYLAELSSRAANLALDIQRLTSLQFPGAGGTPSITPPSEVQQRSEAQVVQKAVVNPGNIPVEVARANPIVPSPAAGGMDEIASIRQLTEDYQSNVAAQYQKFKSAVKPITTIKGAREIGRDNIDAIAELYVTVKEAGLRAIEGLEKQSVRLQQIIDGSEDPEVQAQARDALEKINSTKGTVTQKISSTVLAGATDREALEAAERNSLIGKALAKSKLQAENPEMAARLVEKIKLQEDRVSRVRAVDPVTARVAAEIKAPVQTAEAKKRIADAEARPEIKRPTPKPVLKPKPESETDQAIKVAVSDVQQANTAIDLMFVELQVATQGLEQWGKAARLDEGKIKKLATLYFNIKKVVGEAVSDATRKVELLNIIKAESTDPEEQSNIDQAISEIERGKKALTQYSSGDERESRLGEVLKPLATKGTKRVHEVFDRTIADLEKAEQQIQKQKQNPNDAGFINLGAYIDLLNTDIRDIGSAIKDKIADAFDRKKAPLSERVAKKMKSRMPVITPNDEGSIRLPWKGDKFEDKENIPERIEAVAEQPASGTEKVFEELKSSTDKTTDSIFDTLKNSFEGRLPTILKGGLLAASIFGKGFLQSLGIPALVIEIGQAILLMSSVGDIIPIFAKVSGAWTEMLKKMRGEDSKEIEEISDHFNVIQNPHLYKPEQIKKSTEVLMKDVGLEPGEEEYLEFYPPRFNTPEQKNHWKKKIDEWHKPQMKPERFANDEGFGFGPDVWMEAIDRRFTQLEEWSAKASQNLTEYATKRFKWFANIRAKMTKAADAKAAAKQFGKPEPFSPALQQPRQFTDHTDDPMYNHEWGQYYDQKIAGKNPPLPAYIHGSGKTMDFEVAGEYKESTVPKQVGDKPKPKVEALISDFTDQLLEQQLEAFDRAMKQKIANKGSGKISSKANDQGFGFGPHAYIEAINKKINEVMDSAEQRLKKFADQIRVNRDIQKERNSLDELLAQESNKIDELLAQESNKIDELLGKQSSEIDELLGKESGKIDKLLGKQKDKIGESLGKAMTSTGSRLKGFADRIRGGNTEAGVEPKGFDRIKSGLALLGSNIQERMYQFALNIGYQPPPVKPLTFSEKVAAATNKAREQVAASVEAVAQSLSGEQPLPPPPEIPAVEQIAQGLSEVAAMAQEGVAEIVEELFGDNGKAQEAINSNQQRIKEFTANLNLENLKAAGSDAINKIIEPPPPTPPKKPIGDRVAELPGKAVEATLTGIGKANEFADTKMTRLYNTFKLLGIAFLVFSNAAFIGQTIQGFLRFADAGTVAARSLELLRNQAITATGSLGSGQKLLSRADEIATVRGLTLNAARETQVQFAAATKDTAFEGDVAQFIAENISKGAVAKGLNDDQTKRAVVGFLQATAKERISPEELSGQIAEAGFYDIKPTLARSLGVPTSSIEKLSKSNQLGSSEILKLVSTIGSDADSAPVNPGKTIDATFNRLSNSQQKFMENMGEGTKAILPIIEGLSVAITALGNSLLIVGTVVNSVALYSFAKFGDMLIKTAGNAAFARSIFGALWNTIAPLGTAIISAISPILLLVAGFESLGSIWRNLRRESVFDEIVKDMEDNVKKMEEAVARMKGLNPNPTKTEKDERDQDKELGGQWFDRGLDWVRGGLNWIPGIIKNTVAPTLPVPFKTQRKLNEEFAKEKLFESVLPGGEKTITRAEEVLKDEARIKKLAELRESIAQVKIAQGKTDETPEGRKQYQELIKEQNRLEVEKIKTEEPFTQAEAALSAQKGLVQGMIDKNALPEQRPLLEQLVKDMTKTQEGFKKISSAVSETTRVFIRNTEALERYDRALSTAKNQIAIKGSQETEGSYFLRKKEDNDRGLAARSLSQGIANDERELNAIKADLQLRVGKVKEMRAQVGSDVLKLDPVKDKKEYDEVQKLRSEATSLQGQANTLMSSGNPDDVLQSYEKNSQALRAMQKADQIEQSKSNLVYDKDKLDAVKAAEDKVLDLMQEASAKQTAVTKGKVERQIELERVALQEIGRLYELATVRDQIATAKQQATLIPIVSGQTKGILEERTAVVGIGDAKQNLNREQQNQKALALAIKTGEIKLTAEDARKELLSADLKVAEARKALLEAEKAAIVASATAATEVIAKLQARVEGFTALIERNTKMFEAINTRANITPVSFKQSFNSIDLSDAYSRKAELENQRVALAGAIATLNEQKRAAAVTANPEDVARLTGAYGKSPFQLNVGELTGLKTALGQEAVETPEVVRQKALVESLLAIDKSSVDLEAQKTALAKNINDNRKQIQQQMQELNRSYADLAKTMFEETRALNDQIEDTQRKIKNDAAINNARAGLIGMTGAMADFANTILDFVSTANQITEEARTRARNSERSLNKFNPQLDTLGRTRLKLGAEASVELPGSPSPVGVNPKNRTVLDVDSTPGQAQQYWMKERFNPSLGALPGVNSSPASPGINSSPLEASAFSLGDSAVNLNEAAEIMRRTALDSKELRIFPENAKNAMSTSITERKRKFEKATGQVEEVAKEDDLQKMRAARIKADTEIEKIQFELSNTTRSNQRALVDRAFKEREMIRNTRRTNFGDQDQAIRDEAAKNYLSEIQGIEDQQRELKRMTDKAKSTPGILIDAIKSSTLSPKSQQELIAKVNTFEGDTQSQIDLLRSAIGKLEDRKGAIAGLLKAATDIKIEDLVRETNRTIRETSGGARTSLMRAEAGQYSTDEYSANSLNKGAELIDAQNEAKKNLEDLDLKLKSLGIRGTESGQAIYAAMERVNQMKFDKIIIEADLMRSKFQSSFSSNFTDGILKVGKVFEDATDRLFNPGKYVGGKWREIGDSIVDVLKGIGYSILDTMAKLSAESASAEISKWLSKGFADFMNGLLGKTNNPNTTIGENLKLPEKTAAELAPLDRVQPNSLESVQQYNALTPSNLNTETPNLTPTEPIPVIPVSPAGEPGTGDLSEAASKKYWGVLGQPGSTWGTPTPMPSPSSVLGMESYTPMPSPSSVLGTGTTTYGFGSVPVPSPWSDSDSTNWPVPPPEKQIEMGNTIGDAIVRTMLDGGLLDKWGAGDYTDQLQNRKEGDLFQIEAGGKSNSKDESDSLDIIGQGKELFGELGDFSKQFTGLFSNVASGFAKSGNLGSSIQNTAVSAATGWAAQGIGNLAGDLFKSIGIFDDGGVVGGMEVPAKAIDKAMKAEGAGATLVVAHKGERMLSAKTGDAQLFEDMLHSGEWAQRRAGAGMVPNFAMGGVVGSAVGRAGGSSAAGSNGPVYHTNSTIINIDGGSDVAQAFNRNRDQLDLLQARKASRAQKYNG